MFRESTVTKATAVAVDISTCVRILGGRLAFNATHRSHGMEIGQHLQPSGNMAGSRAVTAFSDASSPQLGGDTDSPQQADAGSSSQQLNGAMSSSTQQDDFAGDSSRPPQQPPPDSDSPSDEQQPDALHSPAPAVAIGHAWQGMVSNW